MTHRLTGLEKRLNEQLGIQEILIGFASLIAEAIQLGKLLDGDRISHFETEQEIIGV